MLYVYIYMHLYTYVCIYFIYVAYQEVSNEHNHISIWPAGGKGSPLIDFLAHMNKQYGDNPYLGEEFMRAIVETQWSKKSFFPFTKMALTVTNCTTNKLVDGILQIPHKN